jgi:TRAP transporter TAXI family solute receptor
MLSAIALGALLAVPLGGALAADPIDQMRARANAGTVGVVSGGVDGTYIRIAADLAAVLDDGDQLRVLAMIGKGSVQNISDIEFLRGIDIGIVQSDVLAYAKRERLIPGVDKSIQYIVKLYDEELHVLAGKDIAKVEDLAGKKVNIDLNGSGTAMTASLVLERLGIAVEPTNFDQALALEKLKQGEIAALAYVTGRPARLFNGIKTEDGLHFLTVPMNPALLETYLPAQLKHEDYPALVPDGQAVDTVAVGAVMAVYTWAPETERYRKVARFVDAFFNNFDAFLKPPRHPKWKEVNLAAQVPGWTRFPPAESWLRRAATVATSGPLRKQFETFLDQSGRANRPSTEEQKAELFQEFLRWQQSQRRASR